MAQNILHTKICPNLKTLPYTVCEKTTYKEIIG